MVAERIAKPIVDLAKGLVADERTISVSSIVPRKDKLNGKVEEVNSYLQRMCSNVNMLFIDNARAINPERHLNNSKLHLNLKGSAKLSDVFINSIKKCTQFDLLMHKADLLVIKISHKLTDDKIDCALEKGNSTENFKYNLSSLRRKNLNIVVLAQLNINSIRNKLDFLA